MRRLVASVVMLVIAATTLVAQEVRGVVRDSASRQPVPGAVVMLLDSGNAVLTRGISNQRGEYRLPLTIAGKQLRTLRLGFRPRLLTLPAPVDGLITIDVNIVAIPIHLETVRTVAARSCPKRADGPVALSILDQARSGLLATIVARSANPPKVRRLKFERRMDANTDRIASQTVRIDSIEAPSPYAAARSASAFIDTGFMDDSAGTQIFYAPDAEVLVDDAFSNGYCFRLMRPEFSRKNQIGVGFSAADSRRGRIDIDGALWIDTAAKTLVDIDFVYRGLGSYVEEYRPGGDIGFRAMPNGVVFVDRWHLRLVGAENSRSPNAPRSRQPAPPPQLFAHEVGGEIADARWPDGTAWHAQLGTLRVHAFRRDSLPIQGVFVELDSTDYHAVTDSSGFITIPDLLPGPYTPVIVDDLLGQIGVNIPAGTSFESERDSTTRMQLEVRSAKTWVDDLCRADHQHPKTAALFAKLFLPNGRAAASSQWSITRFSDDEGWLPVARGRVTSSGLLYNCELTEGAKVQLSAEGADDLRAAGIVNSLKKDLDIVSLTLRPAPKKP